MKERRTLGKKRRCVSHAEMDSVYYLLLILTLFITLTFDLNISCCVTELESNLS